jgi:hypothetical protein
VGYKIKFSPWYQYPLIQHNFGMIVTDVDKHVVFVVCMSP